MMLAGKRGARAMLAMSLEDTLLRLLLALACGAAMGLNRNLHKKAAGVRTFGLVSVGSAIVVLAITQVSSQPTAISPVVQGVLTGIGFLGAGIILHQANSSRVQGLTTAAAVWMTAGLGIACGLGLFSLALCGLAAALTILIIGRPLERFFERLWGHEKNTSVSEDPDDDADG
jgi:putative Mg2+ transporter-C (MgtC) family protein